MLNERWSMCLLDRTRVIWGRFAKLDLAGASTEFRPENAADLRHLSANRPDPYMDDYIGERVEAVLDTTRTWQLTRFEPRDAVQYESGLMTVASEGAPRGGVLVRDGWNHTHCFICRETIGEHTDPTAYVSSQFEWVCETCYRSYVVPRSIAFADN
jgi:hypothetical protein